MIFFVKRKHEPGFAPTGGGKRYRISISRCLFAIFVVLLLFFVANALNQSHPNIAEPLFFISNTLFGGIFGVFLGEWMSNKELDH